MDETELQQLLLHPDRQVSARSALRDVLDAAPRTLTYKHWLSRLPAATAPDEQHCVALLSSFTLETLEPFLQVEAYASGWRARTTYVQLGRWQNALLEWPTALADDTDVVVLLLHDAELLGEDFSTAPEDALNRLQALLQIWRSRSAKPLFLGVVKAPTSPNAQAFDVHLGRAARRDAFQRGLIPLGQQLKDVHLLDLNADSIGIAQWFDPRGYLTTRSVFVHRVLPPVARVLARSLACLFRPRRKVLVLDMDNTLWGGVVGEDGVDGIALGQEFPGSAFLNLQRMALDLRQTGVLLALASKNNESDAMAVFERRPEMLLKPEHFSARRINWIDKPANIAAIAQQLGLGLDSFVFADDSAMECAQVRETLPEVEVVELGQDPSRFVDLILRTQAFDTIRVTDEDRHRADSYAAEANRQELRSAVTDLASFLADCRLHLSLLPASGATVDRIHQLLGKTNQFNFSLLRPSKEVLLGLMERGGCLYAASLSDRFGDYGLIGILQVTQTGTQFEIENMALSCRALGRGVEDAMLAYAHSRALAAGCTSLAARVVRGPRNQQVLQYLDSKGFTRAAEVAGEVDFRVPTGSGVLPWPDFIAVELGEAESY